MIHNQYYGKTHACCPCCGCCHCPLIPFFPHPKCPMYLYMQLHYRLIQINTANIIYMRPCFIGIAYLFASDFVFVLNGTPCKPQLNFWSAVLLRLDAEGSTTTAPCALLCSEGYSERHSLQIKSLLKVTYSPCSNRASPGSTASCACQERKNRHFLEFANSLDFCCGCQYLNSIQLIQATYSMHPTSFSML